MLLVATITSMAIAYMLGWWYGQGWSWLLKIIRKNLGVVSETFSVLILLKTWFSPWKQIQTVSTFRNFFQAAIDNLVSRFIGAVIRTFMLLAAFVLTFVLIAGGLALLIIWPVFPALIFILPIASVVV
jgi:hypothetical protein